MLFDNLNVWKKAHELTLSVYRITKKFPSNEIYGITSQLRRAMSSVPANIVEGQARRTSKEFMQFLVQARGSLAETQYFLILSKDLEYISDKELDEMLKVSEDISRMLNSLINSVKLKC